MQPLEPPDAHLLSAAVGWTELGNLAEARTELAQISRANQNHPDVLEARWMVAAQAGAWEEALQVARTLVGTAPERSSGWLHQAYAVRRVECGGLQQAWDALLPAFNKFPQESIIAYNLSCYACQMRQLDAARVWLKRAAVIGGPERIKAMALHDQDLEPLWPEIKQL